MEDRKGLSVFQRVLEFHGLFAGFFTTADRIFGLLERSFRIRDIKNAVVSSFETDPEVDIGPHQSYPNHGHHIKRWREDGQRNNVMISLLHFSEKSSYSPNLIDFLITVSIGKLLWRGTGKKVISGSGKSSNLRVIQLDKKYECYPDLLFILFITGHTWTSQ